jgi:regulator of protease activity HflC (stomatin/prohibitin superfamily)
LNFHIDPSFVHDLYQKVGLDFDHKVIDPAFNDFVKEVVPNYPITEILPKREEIWKRAMVKLGDNLARYHVVVDDIYFANIRFTPEYEKAIEARQVAQQQV